MTRTKIGLIGIAGTVVLFMIMGSMHPSTPGDPDASSVGHLSPGECMSADKFNSRAADVVSNTDWSKMPGSAGYSAST